MAQDVPEWLTPTFDTNSSFVLYTCNKNTNFFHGSPALAYYSANYPVGAGFSQKITTTRFNIEQQRQEIAEDFLISGDTSLTLERYGNPTCAYYAVPRIANWYTAAGGALERNRTFPANVNELCKHKCIAVYKTNYDLKFLYMNHPYNFFRIIHYIDQFKEYIIREPAYEAFKNKWKTSNEWGNMAEDAYVPDQFVSDKISTFFGWVFAYDTLSRYAPVFKTDVPFELNPDFVENFTRRSGKDIYDDRDSNTLDYANDFLFTGLNQANRYSTRESDLPLADLYCIVLDLLGSKIDGFANNEVINQGYYESPRGIDRHHYEVIFCNVLRDLTRNYDDSRDWQYTGNGIRQNVNVRNFLHRLNKCKIINFNTYSACNFKELSIWTLLVYENITKDFIPPVWGSATSLLAHYVDDYTISKGKYMSQGIGGNSIWDLKKFNQLTSNYPYFVVLSNLLLSSLITPSDIPLLKVVIYTYLNCRHDLHILVCDIFNGLYDSGLPDDKNKHFKFILKTISLYIAIFYNKKDSTPKTYADIFYHLFLITLASYIAKQEHKQFLNQNRINILYTEKIHSDRPLNIWSKNYNYITNVSSTYVAQDQRTHIKNKEYLVQERIQIRSKAFHDYILNHQESNIREAEGSIVAYLEPYHSYYTKKLNLFKKLVPGIDIDSFQYEYAPYIQSLSIIIASFNNNRRDRVTITDNFKESIISLENENLIYTRVEYVLNLLKPIVHTIFDEYSNKQYPRENQKVPRINHNGLNHTRQMFFAAYILQHTNFIKMNNLNNSEIFWLLLASFCVGIGRYDESSHLMNITLTPAKFKTIFNHQEQEILHKHTLIISNMQVNSLCIFASIINAVKKIIMCDAAIHRLGRPNLINCTTILHLSTIGPHNTTKKDYEDFFNFINIGHYLDHCRKTTGYSQLDSSKSPWVMEFLRKYNEGMSDIQIKEKYYTKMYQILELTGYVRDTSIPNIPYSETDDKRCHKYFSGVDENKMLKYINDFDSLYYDLRKTEYVDIQEILDANKERILIERKTRKIDKWNKMITEIDEKLDKEAAQSGEWRQRSLERAQLAERMKGMTYEERMAYRRLEFGRRIRYIPRTRYREHPEVSERKEREKFVKLRESPTVKEMEKEREGAMNGDNILIYEGKRNKIWREYVSQKINQWEREFDTLKTKYPRSTTKIPNAKAVLDSDKEWLRATTPETTDKQHKERENKKVELIEKTRREQQKEAEEKKEAAQRKWEEDEAKRIAAQRKWEEDEAKRIAEQKRRQEEWDKFIYFYDSRENRTMTEEEAKDIWFNKMSLKQQKDWEIEKKEKDRLAHEEQMRIGKEKQIARQKYLDERIEKIERFKQKAERERDNWIFQGELQKMGIENMADLYHDKDLYQEKLKMFKPYDRDEELKSTMDSLLHKTATYEYYVTETAPGVGLISYNDFSTMSTARQQEEIAKARKERKDQEAKDRDRLEQERWQTRNMLGRQRRQIEVDEEFAELERIRNQRIEKQAEEQAKVWRLRKAEEERKKAEEESKKSWWGLGGWGLSGWGLGSSSQEDKEAIAKVKRDQEEAIAKAKRNQELFEKLKKLEEEDNKEIAKLKKLEEEQEKQQTQTPVPVSRKFGRGW